MDAWMDGWMRGWIDEYMDARMNEWMDGCTDGCMNRMKHSSFCFFYILYLCSSLQGFELYVIGRGNNHFGG